MHINDQDTNPPEELAHGQVGRGDQLKAEIATAAPAGTTAAGKNDEKSHHVMEFWVDGERFETEQVEWTPNQIIQKFGERDPATNYLVQIKGGKQPKVSYEGRGNDPIKLHNKEQFQIISTGPTPVSDPVVRTGPDLFIAALRDMGYDPSLLEGEQGHVMIHYMVESGSHAGKQVRLGFVVPADFPLTCPGGPHVSPHIHPISTGERAHPTGGVHKSETFDRWAGGEWQYWSRPFNEWGKTKKTVAIYMAHVWRLWDSQ